MHSASTDECCFNFFFNLTCIICCKSLSIQAELFANIQNTSSQMYSFICYNLINYKHVVVLLSRGTYVSNHVPFAASHIHRGYTWLRMCDKMAGRQTQSRDKIDYCRLKYTLHVCEFRFAVRHSNHKNEVRALVRTPSGQMSSGTPLIIYRITAPLSVMNFCQFISWQNQNVLPS